MAANTKKDLSGGITIGLIIIGIIIISIVFFTLKNEDQTLLNFVYISGSIGTVIALIIAIIQIFKIKKISAITQEAITSTIETLKQRVSLSEVATAKKIIEEIINFTNSSKNEIAMLKTRDLKNLIINFLEDDEFKILFQNDKRGSKVFIDILSVAIMNYDDLLSNRRKPDFRNFKIDLDKLSTILVSFENKLKYKKN